MKKKYYINKFNSDKSRLNNNVLNSSYKLKIINVYIYLKSLYKIRVKICEKKY